MANIFDEALIFEDGYDILVARDHPGGSTAQRLKAIQRLCATQILQYGKGMVFEFWCVKISHGIGKHMLILSSFLGRADCLQAYAV